MNSVDERAASPLQLEDIGVTLPAPADFSIALAEGFARRIGGLARRGGASAEAVKWAARAAFAASRATSEGHVCVPLSALARRFEASIGEVRANLLASGMASDMGSESATGSASESASESASKSSSTGGANRAASLPLVIDGQARLYLARYYDYERRLARSLVAHAASAQGSADIGTASAHELHERLLRYFGPPNDDEIDWQRVAAVMALSGRLTIVSGGPGTGKTTTVVGLLACLLDARSDLRIALAAPTGKAAQRMQEALLARAGNLPAELAARLPQTSYTLHRLLGSAPGGGFRHHRDNPLPYDVVVIDEASMIDVAMAAHVLDAIAPHTRLIMLGDKDQLAAVEAGAVFAELSARPDFTAAGVQTIAAALGIDETRFAQALPRVLSHEDERRGNRVESRSHGADLFDAPPDDLFAEPPAGFLFDDPAATSVFSESEDSSWPPLESTSRGGRAWSSMRETNGPLANSVVWLERNYRFGLDSPIGRLSLAIRNGAASEALEVLLADTTQHAAALYEDAHATLSERTVERLAKGFSPYASALANALRVATPDPLPLFDVLNRFRVLCATRAGARGVDQLNAVMAAQVRRVAGVTLAVGAQWFAGRPVMVTRNDYALGLFNGDIGIALPGAGGALRVYFRTGDGSVRAVSPAALPPHDTAFALTVHKSQGSEFEHAVLMLPAAFSRVLSRELVYTAITRARERVEVIGARAVLAQAIATPTQRDSGLAARIREMTQER